AGLELVTQRFSGNNGRADGLETITFARRCRIDKVQVADGIFERVENTGSIDHMIRLGSGRTRLLARPAIARVDETKLCQTEIGHRACHHSDVFAKLRFDEDNGWSFRDKRAFAVRA